jgi:hypothetical protein
MNSSEQNLSDQAANTGPFKGRCVHRSRCGAGTREHCAEGASEAGIGSLRKRFVGRTVDNPFLRPFRATSFSAIHLGLADSP